RFPEADEVLAMDFVTALRQLPINANTSIVVATRGHKYDDLALLEAARSPASYVGLVGSKRKTLLIYRELLRQGIPTERLREVHAPVGLNIGARTPEEIALSILAEVTMVRLGGDGRPMKLDEHLLFKAQEKASASALR
ncbi:MAG: XdhC family protein, partial [Chloroflexi bacterium]|nr:XdhC family protein [Chloroflexota bacterium]